MDVYLAPSKADTLDELFSAMTKCAELHPDPMEEGGEEGSSGMFGAGGTGGFDWADSLLASGGGEATPHQFDGPQ